MLIGMWNGRSLMMTLSFELGPYLDGIYGEKYILGNTDSEKNRLEKNGIGKTGPLP